MKPRKERQSWRNSEGKLHRLDGPAVVDPDGQERWYKNGDLHREDGPARVTNIGTQQWYLNGKANRVDGPAVIYANGTKEWLLNGQLHRLDGPAIERSNGVKEFFVYGREVTPKTLIRITVNLSLEDALVCCAAHSEGFTQDTVEEVTGWDPDTTPTSNQIAVWRLLVGLTDEHR